MRFYALASVAMGQAPAPERLTAIKEVRIYILFLYCSALADWLLAQRHCREERLQHPPRDCGGLDGSHELPRTRGCQASLFNGYGPLYLQVSSAPASRRPGSSPCSLLKVFPEECIDLFLGHLCQHLQDLISVSISLLHTHTHSLSLSLSHSLSQWCACMHDLLGCKQTILTVAPCVIKGAQGWHVQWPAPARSFLLSLHTLSTLR
jgi:hypothetical protein